jgi:hypothetical protein
MAVEQGPPVAADLGGAMLPVARTRRSNVIAAEGLTANRRAAARAELPAATARTKRSRKSAESGAVITTSSACRHTQAGVANASSQKML